MKIIPLAMQICSEMTKVANASNEQENAEAKVENFEAKLGPFVVAAETTRMAMVFTDAKQTEQNIIFANDAMLQLTGYTRDEVLGQAFNFLLTPPVKEDVLAKVRAEFEEDKNPDLEVLFRRKDGTDFWAAIFVNPVRDEKGEILQYFASFVDVTKHRDEEAHSKILIDELNHRVKNTLATVQSIVRQATRSSYDPTEIRKAIESRLLALSRSHNLLTREQWKSAGLRDIVHDSLEPFGIDIARTDRFIIRGENIRFPPKAALATGMAFNELATNAVKYGSLSNEAGSITVEWNTVAAIQGKQLKLEWREIGGPLVSQSERRGFGTVMIERGLSLELNGTVQIDYRPDGIICTMNFPLPNYGING